MCHNAHSPAKEKKTCTSCHTHDHQRLPSKDKHLRALGCLACHGNPNKGRIDIKVALPKGHTLQKAAIDRDNNNLVDGKEWDDLTAHLKKERKKPALIKKTFTVSGSSHDVAAKPVGCQDCHGSKSLFESAVLNVAGTPGFSLPMEGRIFVPDLPDRERYKLTHHGKMGVKCTDCHVSQERIDDSICADCHQDVYDTYKGTIHAKKGATQCIDCHSPHSIRPYKSLTAEDRISVCARCHVNYLEKHAWLPNTLLHFKYLECSTCHSPGSTKSIVFYVGMKRDNKDTPLNYQHMEKAYGPDVNVAHVIDKNRDNTVISDELSHFFQVMNKKFDQSLYIGSSIMVTKVHHDYSVKEEREKLCSACHSDHAPFYDSMYLVLPGKAGQTQIPVKGTVLSALPTSVFIDMCLLGETKIKREDWQNIMRASGKERAAYVRELGFKWIDLGGIVITLVVLVFIAIHVAGRVLFRR